MHRRLQFYMLLTVLAGALVLGACGATAPAEAPVAAPTAAPAAAPTAAPTAAPENSGLTQDPITGAPALARGALQQWPIVVMIDNHPNAYPQAGLNSAAIVFEALAEFGLTRFMAVYAPGITPDAASIGPVRSARLYFVQWAMGFGGLYVHAGGAPQALELLQSTTALVDVDALFRARSIYFSRSSERAAPHNLYTDSATLNRAANELAPGPYTATTTGFVFKPDAPLEARPAAKRIEYFFIYREDPAGWTYDPSSNSYYRLRRGRPAIDATTGAQLRVKNVVVMEVTEAPIPGDDKGRIEQVVIGSGRARVFLDGVEREVTWRKDTAEGQLGFYEANGNEVAFNVGQVWIVALPSLDNLTVS